MPVNVSLMLSKLRSYARVYGWLLSDLSRSATGAVLAVVGSSFIGVTTRFAAIGAVLVYAEARSTGNATRFWGIELPATADMTNLLLWSAAVLALALLTAAFTYLAERLSFHTAQQYSRRAVGSVMEAFEASAGPQVPNLPEHAEHDFVRRLLARDMNMLIRSVLIMLRSAVPIITFLGATVALFMFHVGLSLIVAALLIVYALPFFLLNAQVVRASRSREEHAVGVSTGVRRLLPMLLNRRGASDHSRAWAELFHRRLPVEQNLDALKDILLARKRVALLQDVFFGAALVVSMIVFGSLVSENPSAWAIFAGYLIALRFVSTSMKSLAAYITSTNRFLPQVRRYVDFVRSSRTRRYDRRMRADRSRQMTASADGLVIRCADPPLSGSEDSLRLQPGFPVCVIDMQPLHVGTLRRWCRRLCGSSAAGDALWWDAFYLGAVQRLPELSIAAIVAHDLERARTMQARFEAVLDQLGLYEQHRALPHGIETVLDDSTEARLSRPLRYALALMEGILSDQRVFILEWSPLTSLGDEFCRRILEALSDRVVLIAVSDIDNLPDTAVIVLDRAVIGIGDRAWFDSIDDDLDQRWRLQLEARELAVHTLCQHQLVDDDDDD